MSSSQTIEVVANYFGKRVKPNPPEGKWRYHHGLMSQGLVFQKTIDLESDLITVEANPEVLTQFAVEKKSAQGFLLGSAFGFFAGLIGRRLAKQRAEDQVAIWCELADGRSFTGFTSNAVYQELAAFAQHNRLKS